MSGSHVTGMTSTKQTGGVQGVEITKSKHKGNSDSKNLTGGQQINIGWHEERQQLNES